MPFTGRTIHDRMPLIMPGDFVNDWIKPNVKPEELLDAALTDMVYEKVENDRNSTISDEQMTML